MTETGQLQLRPVGSTFVTRNLAPSSRRANNMNRAIMLTAVTTIAATPAPAVAAAFHTSVSIVNSSFASNFDRSINKSLADLHALAEDEDITWAKPSEWRLREFFVTAQVTKEPDFYIRETGNLRAVWSEGREQIGLQFFPNGIIQYVFFKQRPAFLARMTGQDTVEGLMHQVDSLNLTRLMRS